MEEQFEGGVSVVARCLPPGGQGAVEILAGVVAFGKQVLGVLDRGFGQAVAGGRIWGGEFVADGVGVAEGDELTPKLGAAVGADGGGVAEDKENGLKEFGDGGGTEVSEAVGPKVAGVAVDDYDVVA